MILQYDKLASVYFWTFFKYFQNLFISAARRQSPKNFKYCSRNKEKLCVAEHVGLSVYISGVVFENFLCSG